jgi:hypothetical protein
LWICSRIHAQGSGVTPRSACHSASVRFTARNRLVFLLRRPSLASDQRSPKQNYRMESITFANTARFKIVIDEFIPRLRHRTPTRPLRH